MGLTQVGTEGEARGEAVGSGTLEDQDIRRARVLGRTSGRPDVILLKGRPPCSQAPCAPFEILEETRKAGFVTARTFLSELPSLGSRGHRHLPPRFLRHTLSPQSWIMVTVAPSRLQSPNCLC